MARFIIAQHAADGHWQNHYKTNPNMCGLHSVHSIHASIEGCSLQSFYQEDEHKLAVDDCIDLNKRFPNKGYAVVLML